MDCGARQASIFIWRGTTTHGVAKPRKDGEKEEIKKLYCMNEPHNPARSFMVFIGACYQSMNKPTSGLVLEFYSLRELRTTVHCNRFHRSGTKELNKLGHTSPQNEENSYSFY